jgi:hypothetical protein
MTCLLCRWLISNAENARGPLSGRARAHLAGCPGCASFARSVREIGRRLHDERLGLAVETPPRLVERVLAGREAGPGRRWSAGRVVALGVIAVALAVGASALLQTSAGGRRPMAETQEAPQVPVLPEDAIVQAISPRLLEHEMAALTTGTRNAITFLHTRVAPQLGSAD